MVLAIVAFARRGLPAISIVMGRTIMVVGFAVGMYVRGLRTSLVDMRRRGIFGQAVCGTRATERHCGVWSENANGVEHREPDRGFQTESLGQASELSRSIHPLPRGRKTR